MYKFDEKVVLAYSEIVEVEKHMIWDPQTRLWGYRRGNTDATVAYGIQDPYVAELLAITVAMWDFGHLSFNLFTDSREFLSVIEQGVITERQKIRQKGRPLLRLVLEVYNSNPQITFRFVSTKTSLQCIEVTGLKKADHHARIARSTDPQQFFELNRFDYPLLITHNDYPLLGDYRFLLDEIMWKYQFTNWSKCTRHWQSLCLTYVKEDIKRTLTSLRKLVGPTNKTSSWFVDSVLHNLPNHRMVNLNTVSTRCPICHHSYPDDTTHYLTCTALQHLLVKIHQPNPKYISSSWRDVLVPNLLSQFQTLIKECQTFILQSLPGISVSSAQGMVNRYWINLILQRTTFSYRSFHDTCFILGGQNPPGPVDINTLTPPQFK